MTMLIDGDEAVLKTMKSFWTVPTFALAIDNLTVNSGWTFPTDFDEVLDE